MPLHLHAVVSLPDVGGIFFPFFFLFQACAVRSSEQMLLHLHILKAKLLARRSEG